MTNEEKFPPEVVEEIQKTAYYSLMNISWEDARIIAVNVVKILAEHGYQKVGSDEIAVKVGAKCPFDGGVNHDLEPTDPCPVCGDLGTWEDNPKPSRCIS